MWEMVAKGTVDRSLWPKGPWDKEPEDRVAWNCKETKYRCVVQRGPMGSWNGYVGVPKSHPAFQQTHQAMETDSKYDNIRPHGGVTFTDHIDEDGEYWYIGFDTGHAGDTMPKLKIYLHSHDDTYRDLAYITKEVNELAKQLHAIH